MDKITPILKIQESFTQRVLNWIFFVEKEDISIASLSLQCLFYIALFFFGISFFDEINFNKDPYAPLPIAEYFLHNVNLIFHEAGHWIFGPFGSLMGAFGGSLMQCLIPLVVMIQFLRQRDNFGASVGLWWFGQNFLDVAPYIYDAWDKKLPLLGGIIGQENPDVHDWHFILTRLDIMEHYSQIAFCVGYLGIFLICLSFLWAGVILYKKFLLLQSDS